MKCQNIMTPDLYLCFVKYVFFEFKVSKRSLMSLCVQMWLLLVTIMRDLECGELATRTDRLTETRTEKLLLRGPGQFLNEFGASFSQAEVDIKVS